MGGSRSPAFSAHTRPRQLADELLRPKGGPEIPSDLKGVEDCEYTQFPLDPKTDQVTEDKIRLFVEKLRSRFQAFITTFDLVLNDNGEWENGEFINEHNLLIDKYNELLSRYNKLVRDYNHHAVVPQPVGRPIAASEAQQAEVAKHHKRSKVARWIAEEMALSRRTVTIIGKLDGSDRTGNQHRRRLGLEPKRKDWRPAAFARLPKQATKHLEQGRKLLKEAKGLGR
jgi:hypothetical protein